MLYVKIHKQQLHLWSDDFNSSKAPTSNVELHNFNLLFSQRLIKTVN